jgi:hypothetical protein
MKYTISHLKSLCKQHNLEFEYNKEEVAAYAPKGYIFKDTTCGVAIYNFDISEGKQNAINSLVKTIKSGIKKKERE